jgi:hypothetical protein
MAPTLVFMVITIWRVIHLVVVVTFVLKAHIAHQLHQVMVGLLVSHVHRVITHSLVLVHALIVLQVYTTNNTPFFSYNYLLMLLIIGYFSPASSLGCTACAAGTYTTTGQHDQMCTLCAMGTYQPSTASTSCIACAAGLTTYFNGATSSSQCVTPV